MKNYPLFIFSFYVHAPVEIGWRRLVTGCRTAGLFFFCCCLFFGVAGPSAHALIKNYSLVERTRQATVIIQGDVIKVSDKDLEIIIRKVNKGVLAANTVVAGRYPVETTELLPQRFSPGEQYIFFLSKDKDGRYELFSNQQERIDPNLNNEPAGTIQQILELDSAKEPAAKTKLLQKMLDAPTPFAKAAALEIIYREIHSGRFLKEPLISHVVDRTHDQDTSIVNKAILALSVMGDASVIPTLLELLRSKQPGIPSAAGIALRNMTGVDIAFQEAWPKEKKEEAIKKWESWWQEHKGNVKVIQ